MAKDMKIQLGDKVKHRFSGFSGTAVARTTYLSGCDRITIQPKVKKDGTLPDSTNFDEPEIEIVKSRKVKNKNENFGGWQPTVKHYIKN